MEYSIKTGDITKQRSACLILGVYSKRKLSSLAQEVDQASQGHLSSVLKRGDIDGDVGQQLMLYDVPGTQAERILLVGLGKSNELDRKQLRKALTGVVKTLDQSHAIDGINGLADLELTDASVYQTVRDCMLTVEDALYAYTETKSEHKKTRPAAETPDPVRTRTRST
jgi:leucyl aminopeptidase